MSDKFLHDDSPSQDWSGGSPWVRPMREHEQAQAEIHRDRSEERFLVIRNVLQDSGIPFPRANELAERCHKALKEIG